MKTSKSVLKRLKIQRGWTKEEEALAREHGMIIDDNVIDQPPKHVDSITEEFYIDTPITREERNEKRIKDFTLEVMAKRKARLIKDLNKVNKEVFGYDIPISLEDQKFLKKVSFNAKRLNESLVKQKSYHEKALSHYKDSKRLQLTDNQSDMLNDIFLKNNNNDLKRLNEKDDRNTKLRLGKSKMVINLLKEFSDIAIIVPDKNRKYTIIGLFDLTRTEAKRVIIIKPLKEK